MRMADFMKFVAELKAERALVEDAIRVLQQLELRRGKPRGRPPAWMKEALPQRGRPKGSKDKGSQIPGSGPSGN